MKEKFSRKVILGGSRITPTLIAIMVMALMLCGAYFLIGAGSESRDVYASVYKGDTKSYRFTVRNAYTYSAVDLTDHIVKFLVKKNPSDTSFVIDKTCTISDAKNGQATVSLSSTDTDIDAGTYYAYIVLTDEGEEASVYETLLKSKWVVTQ